MGRLGNSDDRAWLGFSAVRILGSPCLAVSGATDGFLVAEMVAEGLVRDAADRVQGVVVGGLTSRDVARLAAYEGSGYRIARLKVFVDGEIVTVSVFEPSVARLQPSTSPWDYTLWKGRHKRPFVARLRKGLSGR